MSECQDVFDGLEARGRAIVERLALRWTASVSSGTRAVRAEARFAEAREYQALLVGHVDYARRPAPAAHELTIRRGHVELILAVLRLMRSLETPEHADRAAGW